MLQLIFYNIIVLVKLHVASTNYVILSYYGLLTREPFSYSVVWVGIVGHYTFLDNTIGERFPREKYIINLVHNMYNG